MAADLQNLWKCLMDAQKTHQALLLTSRLIRTCEVLKEEGKKVVLKRKREDDEEEKRPTKYQVALRTPHLFSTAFVSTKDPCKCSDATKKLRKWPVPSKVPLSSTYYTSNDYNDLPPDVQEQMNQLTSLFEHRQRLGVYFRSYRHECDQPPNIARIVKKNWGSNRRKKAPPNVLLEAVKNHVIVASNTADDEEMLDEKICEEREKSIETFVEFFNGSSDHSLRPYISRKIRAKLKNGEMKLDTKYTTNLKPDDVIHVPLARYEKLLFESDLRKNEDLGFKTNMILLSKKLPGRVARDLERFAHDNYEFEGERIAKKKTRTPDEQKLDACIVRIAASDTPRRRHPQVPSPFSQLKPRRSFIESKNIFDVLSERQGVGRTLKKQNSRHITSTKHRATKCKFERIKMTSKFHLDHTIHNVEFGTHVSNKHMIVTGMGEEQEDIEVHGMLINSRTGAKTPLSNHTDGITEVLFTHDGRHIISGGRDNKVNLYDSSGRFLHNFVDEDKAIICLARHNTRHNLISSCGRKSKYINLHNTETYATTRTNVYSRHASAPPYVVDMCFGEKGTALKDYFFVSTEDHEEKNQAPGGLLVYHLTNSALRYQRTVPSFRKSVYSVHCSPTHNVVMFSCGSDKLYQVDMRIQRPREFSVGSQGIIRTLPSRRGDHIVNEFGFSPCGTLLQTSGHDLCVFVHDFRYLARGPVLVLEHDYTNAQTSGIASEWTQDSDFIVTGCDDCSVRVWDVRGPQLDAEVAVVSPRDFGPDFGAICALDVSRDQDQIVCGTIAGNVAVCSTLYEPRKGDQETS